MSSNQMTLILLNHGKKNGRIIFPTWHQRFPQIHLDIMTWETCSKLVVTDLHSSSSTMKHLNDKQVGAGGVARQERVNSFLSKRRRRQFQPAGCLTTKYHRHLLQAFEGRVIFWTSSERYESWSHCCPILGWTELRWPSRSEVAVCYVPPLVFIKTSAI